jgi:hypothetical protein
MQRARSFVNEEVIRNIAFLVFVWTTHVPLCTLGRLSERVFRHPSVPFRSPSDYHPSTRVMPSLHTPSRNAQDAQEVLRRLCEIEVELRSSHAAMLTMHQKKRRHLLICECAIVFADNSGQLWNPGVRPFRLVS